MLEIGVFSPFGTDHDRNLLFCQDTDVHHIILSAASVAAEGSDGVPAPGALADSVSHYAGGGVALASLTPSRLSTEALRDNGVRENEVDVFRRILESMGRAGIPLLHFYLGTDPAPDDPGERARLWDSLVDIYRELAQVAETAGVRISTHHYHRPDRLLWNHETMHRLLEEVGSPSNGVTFCQGKSQLAGDDLAASVRDYGERIFMVHLRDIVTRVSDPISDETRGRLADYGYLEVALGTGEVDMAGTVRALKQAGYGGQVYPEHFPSIAGDRAAGLAWTIGYIRALDGAIED